MLNTYRLQKDKWSSYCLTTARISLVLLMFGVTTSVALSSIASMTLVICWLLGGELKNKWKELIKNPLSIAICSLMILILVNSIWSEATNEEIRKNLLVYSRLFLILVIFYYLSDDSIRKACWIAFFSGCAITLVSTYLNLWMQIPWSKSQLPGWGNDHSVFHDYIAQGIILTFFSIVILTKAINQKKPMRIFFYLFIFSLSIFSITHLTSGRTAYVALFFSLLICLFLYLNSIKSKIIFLLIFLGIFTTLYSSEIVQNRIQMGLSDINKYSNGQYESSLGYRIKSWAHSIDYVIQSPFIGHGTGSYSSLCKAHFTNFIDIKIACVHPHNQYLFFLIEHGLIGLSIYIGIFLICFSYANKYPIPEKIIAFGLLTILAIDSCINSTLWISSLRNFYTALFPLVFATALAQSTQK